MRSRLFVPTTIAAVILVSPSVSGAQDSDWADVIALHRGQEVSLVGFPVAGALVGYLPRREDVIVYRSSAPSR